MENIELIDNLLDLLESRPNEFRTNQANATILDLIKAIRKTDAKKVEMSARSSITQSLKKSPFWTDLKKFMVRIDKSCSGCTHNYWYHKYGYNGCRYHTESQPCGCLTFVAQEFK